MSIVSHQAEKKPDPAARLRSTFSTCSALKIGQVNSIVCMKIFVTSDLSTGTPNARTRRACGIGDDKKTGTCSSAAFASASVSARLPCHRASGKLSHHSPQGLPPIGCVCHTLTYILLLRACRHRKHSQEVEGGLFQVSWFLERTYARSPDKFRVEAYSRSEFRMCVFWK